MSNTKDTVNKLSPKESKMASLMKRQSLETLTASLSLVQLKNTRALSTWLRQVFPANHSQLQESKREKTTRATSGLRPSNVYAIYDQDTHSWRTSQVCLIQGTSQKFSGRWPKQGLMQGGLCWEQTMWAHHTEGKDSGLWPTPTQDMVSNRTNGSQYAYNAEKPSRPWPPEPELGRVTSDGVAHRVDRLKAIGNGQVPLVVAQAWEILK